MLKKDIQCKMIEYITSGIRGLAKKMDFSILKVNREEDRIH